MCSLFSVRPVSLLVTAVVLSSIGCLQPGFESSDESRSVSESDVDIEPPEVEVDPIEDQRVEPCDDGYLVHAVSSLWQMLDEKGEARQRLRNRCGDGESVRFDECSCGQLRDYLTEADEIDLWRAKCCATSENCPRNGRCAPGDVAHDRLVAELKEGAEIAIAMMQSGLDCPDVGCVGTSRTCLLSRACTTDGRCGVDDDGRCVPTEDEHCRMSDDCADRARCTLTEPGGECVRESDDDCAQSNGCEERGWCRLNERTGWCEAGADEHCRQSKVCAEAGRCYFRAAPDDPRRRDHCYSRVEEGVEAAKTGVVRAERAANVHPLRRAVEGGAEFTASIRRDVDAFRVEVVDSWADVRVTVDDARQREFNVDCFDYIELAREFGAREVFEQGRRLVIGERARVRTGDHVLWDFADTICESTTKRQRELLSWVGPAWSFKQTSMFSDYYGRGYVSRGWTVYDLDTGEEAPLDLLVTADSIMSAIKSDSWVADHLESVREVAEGEDVDTEERGEARHALDRFDEADDLDDLEEALSEVLRISDIQRMSTRHWNYGQLFGGYAFADYDATRNRVAMRLELRDRESRPPRTVVTLGLWVEPHREARGDFRRAQREGWLKPEAKGQWDLGD